MCGNAMFKFRKMQKNACKDNTSITMIRATWYLYCPFRYLEIGNKTNGCDVDANLNYSTWNFRFRIRLQQKSQVNAYHPYYIYIYYYILITLLHFLLNSYYIRCGTEGICYLLLSLEIAFSLGSF